LKIVAKETCLMLGEGWGHEQPRPVGGLFDAGHQGHARDPLVQRSIHARCGSKVSFKLDKKNLESGHSNNTVVN